MEDEDSELNEVLFEMIPLGNMIKVTAIDPKTGTEVSVGGPATSSEYSLKRAAKRRLEYVLAKQREKG